MLGTKVRWNNVSRFPYLAQLVVFGTVSPQRLFLPPHFTLVTALLLYCSLSQLPGYDPNLRTPVGRNSLRCPQECWSVLLSWNILPSPFDSIIGACAIQNTTIQGRRHDNSRLSALVRTFTEVDATNWLHRAAQVRSFRPRCPLAEKSIWLH